MLSVEDLVAVLLTDPIIELYAWLWRQGILSTPAPRTLDQSSRAAEADTSVDM